jgi:hypothetical protein
MWPTVADPDKIWAPGGPTRLPPEPPIVPVNPGPTLLSERMAALGERVSVLPHPVIVESRWTKVSRLFAIVRDMLIIAILAALIFSASSILGRIGYYDPAPTGNPGNIPPTCPSAATDQWGTFCPETPGG